MKKQRALQKIPVDRSIQHQDCATARFCYQAPTLPVEQAHAISEDRHTQEIDHTHDSECFPRVDQQARHVCDHQRHDDEHIGRWNFK